MDHLLPHEIINKIANAQREHQQKIKISVDIEIQYIKDSIKLYIEKDLERLIQNPFNTYVKIPFKDYNYKDKLYVSTFKHKYTETFRHTLILDTGSPPALRGCFVVHFTSYQLLNIDNRPDTNSVSVLAREGDSDESAKQCITEDDKKIFENRLDQPRSGGELRSAEHRPLQGSAKESLVPLFLGRRNSRLSIPTMSSRKHAPENSLSETERSIV
jgi:hypothetical protein